MILNVILQDAGKDNSHMFEKLGAPIHELLAGNKDYVESNIVLNIDETDGTPTCNLFIDASKCKDKDFIREKAKQAIDLFIDNL